MFALSDIEARKHRMLQFYFTVNHSFISWPIHPITVPRGQVEYAHLKAEGLHGGVLTVLCPDGSSLSGNMYSAVAGFGPYYQIRMAIPPTHPILELPVGYRLSVQLERTKGTNLVRLCRFSP